MVRLARARAVGAAGEAREDVRREQDLQRRRRHLLGEKRRQFSLSATHRRLGPGFGSGIWVLDSGPGFHFRNHTGALDRHP